MDPSSNSTLYALADETLCPRNREEAVARGRTCLRKCNSDSDCISTRKKCLCDGLCGWSCVRPGNIIHIASLSLSISHTFAPLYFADLSCDELGQVSNGRVSTPNGNFFNSKVTYECETGYFMSGGRERICQGDSSWSGQSPDCKVRRKTLSSSYISVNIHIYNIIPLLQQLCAVLLQQYLTRSTPSLSLRRRSLNSTQHSPLSALMATK